MPGCGSASQGIREVGTGRDECGWNPRGKRRRRDGRRCFVAVHARDAVDGSRRVLMEERLYADGNRTSTTEDDDPGRRESSQLGGDAGRDRVRLNEQERVAVGTGRRGARQCIRKVRPDRDICGADAWRKRLRNLDGCPIPIGPGHPDDGRIGRMRHPAGGSGQDRQARQEEWREQTRPSGHAGTVPLRTHSGP